MTTDLPSSSAVRRRGPRRSSAGAATPTGAASTAAGAGAGAAGFSRVQAGFDAAVQRYLVELAQRYLPFLLVIGVLLLLVIEAPTTRSTAHNSNLAAGGGSYLEAGGSGSTGSVGQGAGGTSTAGQSAAGGIGASSTGAAISASGAYGAGSGGSAAVVGNTGQSSAAGGYAVSGVRCTPGALQVTWSPYAPPCEPAWHGNNGGSTARGVTSTTITLSYREEGEAGDVNAVRAILPGVLPTDPQVLYDLNVYLQIFNKSYELYGRHVVVKPYMAQGDALQELVGEDSQGAQEDAATAAGMGAFGDVTPLPTDMYAGALVQNHVVAFNNLLLSRKFLTESSPYAYTVVPDLDEIGNIVEAVGCQVGTTPVSFAGNTSLNGQQRVFGVILPEDPQYQGLENSVVNGLRSCGVKLPTVINYEINLSDIQSEMQNAISQMKASHVTSVVCGCDPTGIIYATQAADQQDYHPEWLSEWLPDQFARNYSQDQWAHDVSIGLGPFPAPSQMEAYQVFKLADPNGQPDEPYYWYIYYQLLYVFNGLQAAGPDLTPATLLAGFQHLPPTGNGQVGQWTYGPGSYWPISELQVTYWDPTKVSPFDDKLGDYNSCFGGKWFSVTDTSFPRTLDCPGLPP
jgi:hypothetical protein